MTDGAHRAIWLLDPASGAQRPLIGSGASQSHPRWSPDGKRLAYVSSGEDHRPQLFVYWLDSGASARIADLPEAPTSVARSPDSRQIAFTMLVRDDGQKLGAPLAASDGASGPSRCRSSTACTSGRTTKGIRSPVTTMCSWSRRTAALRAS